jgi:hypothetical protein
MPRMASENVIPKAGIVRNRFMDNQHFEKFLSQKDCFGLQEKIDWRDVRNILFLNHLLIFRTSRYFLSKCLVKLLTN